jgi:hypothetical protein
LIVAMLTRASSWQLTTDFVICLPAQVGKGQVWGVEQLHVLFAHAVCGYLL